jgi:hypothetical protein
VRKLCILSAVRLIVQGVLRWLLRGNRSVSGLWLRARARIVRLRRRIGAIGRLNGRIMGGSRIIIYSNSASANKLQIDNYGIHQRHEKLSRNLASGKRWLASRLWPRGLRRSPGSCSENYMEYRKERTLVSPRETSRTGDKH